MQNDFNATDNYDNPQPISAYSNQTEQLKGRQIAEQVLYPLLRSMMEDFKVSNIEPNLYVSLVENHDFLII